MDGRFAITREEAIEGQLFALTPAGPAQQGLQARAVELNAEITLSSEPMRDALQFLGQCCVGAGWLLRWERPKVRRNTYEGLLFRKNHEDVNLWIEIILNNLPNGEVDPSEDAML